jgi:anti-sigma regulatory factor (Ser/Thr protein kinase)
MDPPPLTHRVPARPQELGSIRRSVKAYAVEHGVLDPDAVALAVSEAVSNVILHAYADADEPGDVEVIARRHLDDGLVLMVCDDGRGMKPRPDSPGLGVGLPLVATLTERFEVEARSGGGTRLSMVFAAA